MYTNLRCALLRRALCVLHDRSAHLLSLIDELFVEVHTEINTCCKPPNDKGKHFSDARTLVQTLRTAGVYAHMWG